MKLRHPSTSKHSKSSIRSARRKEADRRAKRAMLFERFEDRVMLAIDAGPDLIAIIPNDGDIIRFDGTSVRNEAPRELLFRFDGGQQIDAATLNGITITRGGADRSLATQADNITVLPGFIGVGGPPGENEVVFRFAEALPDDEYQITILGSGANALKNVDGFAFQEADALPDGNGSNKVINFRLDLGAKVLAVVPQPVRAGGPAWNEIDVYFDDPSITGLDASKFQLFDTLNTISTNDDPVLTPTTVSAIDADGRVTLTFAAIPAGNWRLRVGTNETVQGPTVVPIVMPFGGDAGVNFNSTIGSATSVGTLTPNQSVIVRSSIDPQDFALQLPGGNDEPGHRDIPAQEHLVDLFRPDLTGDELIGHLQDNTSQAETYYYSFPAAYGIVNGQTVSSSISPVQRQRAREALDLYANYLGVQFVEVPAGTQAADLGLGPGERFFRIVTGDPRAIDPDIPANSVDDISGFSRTTVGPILDPETRVPDAASVMTTIVNTRIADLDPAAEYGGQYFFSVMQGIAAVLGLNRAYELSVTAGGITVASGRATDAINPALEPVYPGPSDIAHLQHLHRPDSKDIDFYGFTLANAGTVQLELTAERRLVVPSLLDGVISVFDSAGNLVSRNDDYFSEDSYVRISLAAGTYYVAVTASGNSDFDPNLPDSGFGGRTFGAYDLRITHQETLDATDAIVDADGTLLDGDADGVAGGAFNFWFTAGDAATTKFVDKAYTGGVSNGLFATPYKTVAAAFAAATPGQVVRLLANGGADGQLSTPADAIPYVIGKDAVGATYADGASMEAPRGVTVVVDAGAVIKLSQANIGVGSSSVTVDRSEGALQILGTPKARVFITSAFENELGGKTDTSTPGALEVAPTAGNWGGLVFRDDSDREGLGIFLNVVNFADIRYGGGEVSVDGQNSRFSPIHLTKARPTITNNFITRNADSAISADPDSFQESHFQDNNFTADYDRVGPDIFGNSIIENSFNGLFIRIRTQAGQIIDRLTVAARFDDTDIAHVIAESLLVQQNPGGLLAASVNSADRSARLDASLVIDPGTIVKLKSARIEAQLGAQVIAEGVAGKPIIFTSTADDRYGSLLSPRFVDPNSNAKLLDGADAGTDPDNDPAVAQRYAATGAFDTNADNRVFTLIIPANPRTAITDGEAFILSNGASFPVRFEFDSNGATIPGSQVIVLPSGAGNTAGNVAALVVNAINTFAINSNTTIRARQNGAQVIITGVTQITQTTPIQPPRVTLSSTPAEADPAPGDWAGLYFAPTSTGSIDQASISFAGGTATTTGGADFFNAVEIYQADVRVANTVFVSNSDGFDQSAPPNDRRNGLGINAPATIFVRGAQPIIVGNTFRGDGGSVIHIDANSFTAPVRADSGRSIGRVQRFAQFDDNHGPLVRLNKTLENEINGMEIRGGTIGTETIWDDTDIVHVLRSEIMVLNHHTYSGLQLRSSASESLVVKLEGAKAGFTASGRRLDIDDRIGGSLYILGMPGHPVIMTSLADDTVGAGVQPGGQPANNTNFGAGAVSAAPGQWRGIVIDQNANDRNVAIVNEYEPGLTGGVDINGAVDSITLAPIAPQALGVLAPHQKGGDDSRRLGYQVTGVISPDDPNDVDIYRFEATRGTEVWIDIDRTTGRLDTVVDLIASDGSLLATSDDSLVEFNGLPAAEKSVFKNAFGEEDLYSINRYDAGLHVVLTGANDNVSPYFIRVRSFQGGVFDPTAPAGETSGEYRFQLRLQATDEVPGTTVQFSEIRFAINGIDVRGLPAHSPLLGEFAESSGDTTDEGAMASQNLGNLLRSDRNTISVSGELASQTDVDWYRFSLDYNFVQSINLVDNGAKSWATIFDIDYADGLARPDTILSVYENVGGQLQLIFVGRDSDVADDQPANGQGLDTDDLTRGSFGKLDPFIGTVQLPTNQPSTGATAGPQKEYVVAVSSNKLIPSQLNFTGVAAAANPLARLEPLTSVKRIVEEHGDFSGFSTLDELRISSGTDPVAGSVLDIRDRVQLQTSIRQFTLSDVPLLVNRQRGLNLSDGSTGRTEISYTDMGLPLGATTINNITMREDGRLFGVINAPPTDTGNAGALVELDGETGIQLVGTDGIADAELAGGNGIAALAFRNNGPAAPTRFDLYYAVTAPGGTFLYQANPNTGVATTTTPPSPTQGVRGLMGTPATGMAFIGTTLYGVGSGGQFFTINTGSGATTTLFTVPGLQFTGLTAAPKNLDFNKDGILGNDLASTLIAVTNTGAMIAIDTTTNSAIPIFDANGDGIFEQTANVGGNRGIAFSPLDVNLWHPTALRGGDPGHGLNETPDQVRTEDQYLRSMPGSNPFGEREGGYSFYFGFEDQTNAAAPTNYVRYQNGGVGGLVNAQYGFTEVAHSALSVNAAVGDNYNIIGGARGSLITDTFSLEEYAASDKPTLYFNYFLETQGAESGIDGQNMRDSARVFGSADGGVTWVMLATNNSTRAPNRVDVDTSELPKFHTIDDVESRTGDPRQRVQELFDNTGGWRQARVDIGVLAGARDVILRFDFSTRGAMADPGLVLTPNLEVMPGDEFGGAASTANQGNNNFNGFFVDDIIVGLAERGEMVTGVTNEAGAFFPMPDDPQFANPNESLEGPYQLTIRSGEPNGIVNSAVDRQITPDPLNFIDSNERLADGITIVPHFHQSILKTSGIDTVTFTGVPVNTGGGILRITARGDFAFTRSPEFSVSSLELYTEDGISQETFIANVFDNFSRFNPHDVRVEEIYLTFDQLTALRDGGDIGFILDNPFLNSYLSFATSIQYELEYSTSAIPDGGTFTINDGVNTRTFEFNTGGGFDPGSTEIAIDGTETPNGLAIKIRDAINNYAATTANDLTPFRVIASVQGNSDRIDLVNAENVLFDGGFQGFGYADVSKRVGDRNREREQGYTLIANNTIAGSSNYAVKVESVRNDALAIYSPGAPINFNPQHGSALVPGLSIENNLMFGNVVGGVYLAGDPVLDGANGPAARPYARIVNNTIYGTAARQGVGIEINDRAAPVVANNILSGLVTGILVQGDSVGDPQAGTAPVLQGNLYKDNGTNFTLNGATQSFQIQLGLNDPLFVNPAPGVFNFYLAANSQAIDSSIDAVAERDAMLGVIGSLGIDPSPTLAPDIDLFGQTRRDDTSFPNGSGGVGGNVFKDRGALERNDESGPVALLTSPQDNSLADFDATNTRILLTEGLVTEFVIQLDDGLGVNLNDATISSSDVIIIMTLPDGTERTLIDGTDYFFNYDNNNNVIRLTAAAGLFEIKRRYDIELNNGVVFAGSLANPIADIAGNLLRPNQVDGRTAFTITLEDETNDDPIITAPTDELFARQINPADPTTLVLTGDVSTGGTGISIADLDAGSGELIVTLILNNGSDIDLLGNTSGVTIDSDAAFGGGWRLIFRGTVDAINAALTSLELTYPVGYTDEDFDADANLLINVNDQGASPNDRTGTADATVSIAVLPPNRSPDIVAAFDDLPAINEDTANPAGTLITDLLDAIPDPIFDPDLGAVEGIAVIDAASTGGVWQYSLNGGATWLPIGPVSDTQARVLKADATTMVRFVPNPNFFGTPSLTVRAWDQTNDPALANGAAGIDVSGANNGGQTAFSDETGAFNITINSVNDLPVVTPVPSQTTAEDTPKIITLTGTDIEDDAAPVALTAVIKSLPTRGKLYQVDPGDVQGAEITAVDTDVTDSAGRVMYIPNANVNGAPQDSFTWLLRDSDLGESTTSTVAISITAVPDAPQVTSPIADRTVDEDSGDILINLATVFSDPDVATNGDALTYSIQSNSNPVLLTATLEGTNLRVKLGANRNGFGDIRVRATDIAGAFAEDEFRVNVTPVNDPPTATILPTQVTAEDTDKIITLGGTDIDGDVLLAIITALPTRGKLYQVDAGNVRGAEITAINTPVTDATRRVIYAPNADENGTPFDAFQFAVRDPSLAQSPSVTVNINVTPVNDAPRVVNPIADRVVDEDSGDILIDVANVFADPEGSAVTVSIVGNTSLGLLTVTLSGSTLRIALTPNGSGFGDITIRGTDAGGAFVEETFRVTVTPINDPPTAGPESPRSTDEDTEFVITLNGVDVDGDVLTAIIRSLPTRGDLYQVVGGVRGALITAVNTVVTDPARRVIYAPDANQNRDTLGPSPMDDAFTFAVRDPSLAQSADVTITVSVEPINDPPIVANPIADRTVPENAPVVIDLSSVFSDVDIATNSDVLTYTVVANSNAGLITTTIVGTELRLTLFPEGTGFADIRIRATDLIGEFVEDEFRVNVTPFNDPPVVTPLPVQTTLEDIDIFITFNGSDPENDAFVAVITQLPTKGRLFQVAGDARGAQITATNTVVTDPAHRVIFAPDADQNGSPFDTLKYALRDTGASQSADATVQINVTPANDAPIVVAPVADRTVDEDSADLFFDLSGTFFDPDVLTNGDVLSLAIVQNSNPALAGPALNGSLLRVSLAPNASGFADIRVRATDAFGAFVDEDFRITVDPIADPIVANDARVLIQNDAALLVPGQATFANVNGAPVTLQLVSGPQYGGTVELRNDGTFTYRKPANFRGLDRFTYRVADGPFVSNTATVTIESADARVILGFYEDLFGRVPSDQELFFWIDTLRSNTYEFVATQFVRGVERRTNIINQFYLDYLGRPVDAGGLEFWLGEFDRTGGSEVVQIGLLGSEEFYTNAGATPGNARPWVIALYDTLLDRQFAQNEVTDSEINFWAGIVNSASTEQEARERREAVVAGFVTSDEYRGDVIVAGLYLTLLDRNLEPGGRTFWVNQMRDQFDQFGNLIRRGITQDELAIMLLASNEYRQLQLAP